MGGIHPYGYAHKKLRMAIIPRAIAEPVAPGCLCSPARAGRSAADASNGNVASMDARIRAYRPSDLADVLDLSIRAWAPNFSSMERILGAEISIRLHGLDWRAYQCRSVSAVLADLTAHVWVCEDDDGHVAGFAAAHIFDAKRKVGEIVMVAVDPRASGLGLGTALTQHATEWLGMQGMRTAMIGTGGDPGHAAARRTYEKAGYTLMPMAR